MGLKCDCNKCDFCTKSQPNKVDGYTCNANEYTRDNYCSEAIKLMIKTMQSVANKEDK